MLQKDIINRRWFCSLRCFTAFLSLACSTQTTRASQDTNSVASYGRDHSHHPVAHCCMGETCLTNGNRFAVVTTLRSPDYMMALREFSCSLKKTNPDLPLIIVIAEGDDSTSPTVLEELRAFGEVREVEDLKIPNNNFRYSLNWIKVRFWQWEEYDALLIIDADTIVRGSMTHLFHLPTNFAWAHNNGPEGYDYNRGGLIMMRPCLKTYHAMLYITETHEKYQFRGGFAEQDFFTWFFRYTAFLLPLRYNLNFEHVSPQGFGPGGTETILIHFANGGDKQQLANASSTDKVWPFLCYQPQSDHHNSM